MLLVHLMSHLKAAVKMNQLFCIICYTVQICPCAIFTFCQELKEYLCEQLSGSNVGKHSHDLAEATCVEFFHNSFKKLIHQWKKYAVKANN